MSSLRATSLLALALLIGSQLIGHASAATSSGNGGIPGTCYNVATPSPGAGSGDLTYPICSSGNLTTQSFVYHNSSGPALGVACDQSLAVNSTTTGSTVVSLIP